MLRARCYGAVQMLCGDDGRLLGKIELETVQEGLEGDLELLGTSVLAQQPLEPGHRGTAAEVDPAVPVGNGRLPFVEWFLDGRRLCSSDGRLEQQVPEQEAGERPVGADDLLIGEPEAAQRGEEVVDELQAPQRWSQPRRGGVSGGDERERGGVLDGDPTHRVRET